jgi:hypothetical protein
MIALFKWWVSGMVLPRQTSLDFYDTLDTSYVTDPEVIHHQD